MAFAPPTRIVWREREYIRHLSTRLVRGFGAAGAYLVGDVQRSLSVGNVTGRTPSKPGEPPRAVSGILRGAVAYAVQATSSAIRLFIGIRKGPADPYGRRQELGFVGTDSAGRNVVHRPRPFLRPAVRRNRTQILKLISKTR